MADERTDGWFRDHNQRPHHHCRQTREQMICSHYHNVINISIIITRCDSPLSITLNFIKLFYLAVIITNFIIIEIIIIIIIISQVGPFQDSAFSLPVSSLAKPVYTNPPSRQDQVRLPHYHGRGEKVIAV